ncbi:MAG: hypothetical protein JSW51_15095 [Gemmatimonadota bacterium]|nr:MAG: hypothetical protein JSW51_15095 [Gemmatimonadota bacterium]
MKLLAPSSTLTLLLPVLVIYGCSSAPDNRVFDLGSSGSGADARPRVIPVYVIPKDLEFDRDRLALNAAAVEDVRQWYSRVLGGQTFRYDPIVAQQSRHTFAELAADDFQAWWPLLIEEFRDHGLPWDEQSDFKLLFLVQGAGGWAGGDSENGGIDSVAEAGSVSKGDLGGVVLIGDSSLSGILSGACPTTGITGGTVWWCNWDTYRGTIAHELGHTWGIPHPDAFLTPGPDGERSAWSCADLGNTVMQCHWGFPFDSLLSYEASHFRSLRFFQYDGDEQYEMLVDIPPASKSGEVVFHRMHIEQSDVAWTDGRGSGTAFPWAVALGNGSVFWELDTACYGLVAELGRQRGAGGTAAVFVIADRDTLVAQTVGGGPPSALSVDICGARQLELAVRGQGRFRAVFGNPRLVKQADMSQGTD